MTRLLRSRSSYICRYGTGCFFLVNTGKEVSIVILLPNYNHRTVNTMPQIYKPHFVIYVHVKHTVDIDRYYTMNMVINEIMMFKIKPETMNVVLS